MFGNHQMQREVSDLHQYAFPGQMLFMKPVMQETLWGGKRLTIDFPYQAHGEHIGECWGVSAHPNGDCLLEWDPICNSDRTDLIGMTLSQLYATHREMFGNLSFEEFPLQVKFIDAMEHLSIQVHPDDAYAIANENGRLGKSECWYILDCPPDAFLFIGHHAKSREELATMVAEGRYEELLCKVPVKKGDFIPIEPGTLHAITAGCLLLEVQQSNDLTYRLYDFNRLYHGAPRPLHVQKCLDVILVPDPPGEGNVISTADLPVNQLNLLQDCPYYTVWKMTIDQEASLEQIYPFLTISVLDGYGTIDGRPVGKGIHLMLPWGYGTVHFQGEMELILVTLLE
jgi:mannose-6-phosphate isomerase class I